MKILLATDAWTPQVNGVMRTLSEIAKQLKTQGHELKILHPRCFATIPLPGYSEIDLALPNPFRVGSVIRGFAPDAIHIATEGPVGLAVRRFALGQRMPFTTAYHTNFPDCIHTRTGVPRAVTYRLLRAFHADSAGVLVSTPSLKEKLQQYGFRNLRLWTRGVDTRLFRPGRKDYFHLPRPIALYVGRIAAEKNLEAFLKTPFRGSKVLVGDGPDRQYLEIHYPDAIFTGAKTGTELAACYRSADVFVFPSRSDTFGLVMLEALASGIPVAAYPVQGPLDIIGHHGGGMPSADTPSIGCLDENLAYAMETALTASAAACRAHAMRYSWEKSSSEFLGHLCPVVRSAQTFPQRAA